MASNYYPPGFHFYDKQCRCNVCTNHELRLTQCVKEETFFQARRNTGVWSAAPNYYDPNYTNRVSKAQG